MNLLTVSIKKPYQHYCFTINLKIQETNAVLLCITNRYSVECVSLFSGSFKIEKTNKSSTGFFVFFK